MQSLTSEELLVDDLVYLEAAAAHIKRKLNYIRTPILRLPPEVLQLIITAAVHSVAEEVEKEEIWNPLRWILLGHISHRFRVVLLSMHTLWGNTIASTPLSGACELLLERAQNAPIKLHTGTYATTSNTDEFFFRHLERAWSISAVSTRQVMCRLMNQLASGSFPHLVSLKIVGDILPPDPEESRITALYLDKTQFPYNQSAIRAPKLRSLSLHDAFTPFDASSLTSLKLKRHWFGARSADLLPPGPFLDMLRCCLNVQNLALEEHLPDFPSSSSSSLGDRVRLPALRGLSLLDTPDRILSFWSIIEVPVTTLLQLELCSPRDSSLDLIDVVDGTQAFVSHVLRPHFLPVTRLEVRRQTDGFSFNLMMPNDGANDWFTYYPKQLSFTHVTIFALIVKKPPYYSGLTGVKPGLQSYVNVYQLSHIQSLDLPCSILEGLGDSPPETILDLFPSLQTLSIHELNRTFFNFGHPSIREPPPSHPSNVLLHPKLRSLALSSTDFRFTGKDAGLLAALLASRVEARIPIRTLDLKFPADDCYPESGSEDEDEDEDEDEQSKCRNALAQLVIPGPLTIQTDW